MLLCNFILVGLYTCFHSTVFEGRDCVPFNAWVFAEFDFQSLTCPALWEEGRQFPLPRSTRSPDSWQRRVPHGVYFLDQGEPSYSILAWGRESPTSQPCAWGPSLRNTSFLSLPSSLFGSPSGLSGDAKKGCMVPICPSLLSSCPCFPPLASFPLPCLQL